MFQNHMHKCFNDAKVEGGRGLGQRIIKKKDRKNPTFCTHFPTIPLESHILLQGGVKFPHFALFSYYWGRFIWPFWRFFTLIYWALLRFLPYLLLLSMLVYLTKCQKLEKNVPFVFFIRLSRKKGSGNKPKNVQNGNNAKKKSAKINPRR